MRHRGTCLLVLPLALLLFAETAAAQKRYAVEAIDVDARVEPDGALTVTEQITYRYRGQFTFGFRDIPHEGETRIDRITVSEADRPFRRADSEEPGTFTLDTDRTRTRVTWYYRAENGTRTFTVSYRVRGEVRRYADAAELYYKFVDDEWDRDIGRVHVTVRLPQESPRDTLRAWAHGPLHGFVQVDDGAIRLGVAPLPRRQFWEGRLLFPPELVPALPVTPRLVVQDVIAEETRWVEQANAARLTAQEQLAIENVSREQRQALVRPFLFTAFALVGIGFGVWLLFYAQHGRPHDVELRGAPGLPPSTHAPALLEVLTSRTVGVPGLVATLLDLAQRGVLSVRETTSTSHGFFREKQETDYEFTVTSRSLKALEPFERSVIEFLLGEAGSTTTFSMALLKKAARTNQRAFRKWYKGWTAEVKHAAEAQGWFEPSEGRPALLAFTGIVIAIAGLVLSVFSDSPAGVPAIIGGAIVAVLATTLRRRSAEGQRLYESWRAFRQHLRGMARSEGRVTLAGGEWGRYVALAVVFGMHEKLLARLAPHRGDPGWYAGAGHHGALSPASFADGISSMVSAVSSSMSSATGAGGGASGGGDGGGGGGGGGAG